MTSANWDAIKYFSIDENWGDPYMMNSELMFALEALRGFVSKPIMIHCGYEERPKKTSQHNFGRAVDLHIFGLSLWDQFNVAQRFRSFRGIGVYPWWNNPGLHLDTRPLGKYEPIATWGSTAPNRYVKITKQFMFGKI